MRPIQFTLIACLASMGLTISNQVYADAIWQAANRAQRMAKMSESGAAGNQILPDLYDTGSTSRPSAPSCALRAQQGCH